MTAKSDVSPEMKCPRCGETGSGRFCAGCGAPQHGVSCESCNAALVPGARFCNNCGTPVGASSDSTVTHVAAEPGLTKQIAIAAVIALVAFVGGEMVGRRSVTPDFGAPQQADGGAPLAAPAGMPAAPDISSMSPEERASRLFNRVMTYSEQGKMDSARFFAPMAIQAYQMIGPLDAHASYDIGTIAAAAGDAPMGRAEADTILMAQPNHLLGLVLAARLADQTGDAAGATRFRRRLAAAVTAERAKGLKEYTEHARDIDDALAKAGASK